MPWPGREMFAGDAGQVLHSGTTTQREREREREVRKWLEKSDMTFYIYCPGGPIAKSLVHAKESNTDLTTKYILEVSCV